MALTCKHCGVAARVGHHPDCSGQRIAELEAALRDVRARAHFELHNPTPLRDTALSLIIAAADKVLPDKIT